MSEERSCSQHGNLHSPPMGEAMYLALNDNQRTITPSELLRIVQRLKEKLQSFKYENMRDRKG